MINFMFKKKCPGCNRKIEKKFSYCPYCGMSFKAKKEKDDFGMLGRDDFMPEFEKSINQGFGMPFGLDRVMNSLIKQLEKEFNKDIKENNFPDGFRIQISTGKPQMLSPKRKIIKQQAISIEELERRSKLPKEEAESNVRRLSDRIVYEISVPGVTSGKDVLITKLEDSIEIKAYSKNKCFCKTIPLKVEIIGYYVKDDKLFLELKS